VSLTQTYVADQSKLPGIAVAQGDDKAAVKKARSVIDTDVNIEYADRTTSEKAGKALPGKPAIILSDE
jgi:hypothetical protein